MSSENPIVVNCGATHVSVSVFSANGGRLVLERFYVRSLAYNYSNESEWVEALTESLRSIVAAAGLSGAATVIVPGYRLLTKNIKVPLAEVNQKQVIAYEAQRNLPDFHDMVWDSQTISSDAVESEVALFAHRTADALRFTEAVCSTGLKPEIVDAATLLDFQAYRFGRGGVIDDEVLLVNIGARSTNLTFVTPDGFSIQNASIGGNFLTQTVADNLGEDFRVAEELKVHYFMEAGARNQGSQHSRNEKIAAVLDAQSQVFSKRLAQEISRRLINYKRQNKGLSPSRIELTGRASLLPGLLEYLGEALKLPVTYFEPTHQLAIGRNVTPGLLDSISRFQMSEAVGEAARLVLPNPAGVNLIPGEIAARMVFARRKPFLVLASIFFAMAPFPVAWHYYEANKVVKQRLDAASTENSDYQAYLKANLNNDPKGGKKSVETILKEAEDLNAPGDRAFRPKTGIETILKEAEELGKRVKELNAVAEARGNWYSVLAELQRVLVQDGKHTWVEVLSIERPKPVRQDATASARRTTTQPAATAAAAKPAEVKPEPTYLTVTVRALLDSIPPGGNYNSEAVNNKFSEIGQTLKGCSFVSDVVETSADVSSSPNLPKRTFRLTIKPDYQL